MKNFGILTLPLWNNYGGILQSYALKIAIEGLGHKVTFIDYQKKPQNKFEIIKTNLKNYIKNNFYKERKLNLSQTDKLRMYISKNTRDFVLNEFSPMTQVVYSKQHLSDLNNFLDGVVVGSDQVWRPDYAPNWGNYFLDFLDMDKRRVSYAASFGISSPEFSESQVKDSIKELSKFDAISVRELSGVDIVSDIFGFTSEHVLDPTLIVDKKVYEDLVKKYQENQSKGTLFTYILDHNSLSANIINRIEKDLELTSFEVNSPIPKAGMKDSEIESYVYPRITEWLRAFIDAEYIIADSFHGCVFSIIFNKPFVAIGNKERGLTRFHSLLKTFDLESRLVLDVRDVNSELFKFEFDWEKVNIIHSDLKIKALKFLNSSLG